MRALLAVLVLAAWGLVAACEVSARRARPAVAEVLSDATAPAAPVRTVPVAVPVPYLVALPSPGAASTWGSTLGHAPNLVWTAPAVGGGTDSAPLLLTLENGDSR